MRKNIVAGNWKMNNDLPQSETLITDLKKQRRTSNAEVMIAPTLAKQLYQHLEYNKPLDEVSDIKRFSLNQ